MIIYYQSHTDTQRNIVVRDGVLITEISAQSDVAKGLFDRMKGADVSKDAGQEIHVTRSTLVGKLPTMHLDPGHQPTNVLIEVERKALSNDSLPAEIKAALDVAGVHVSDVHLQQFCSTLKSLANKGPSVLIIGVITFIVVVAMTILSWRFLK